MKEEILDKAIVLQLELNDMASIKMTGVVSAKCFPEEAHDRITAFGIECAKMAYMDAGDTCTELISQHVTVNFAAEVFYKKASELSE